MDGGLEGKGQGKGVIWMVGGVCVCVADVAAVLAPEVQWSSAAKVRGRPRLPRTHLTAHHPRTGEAMPLVALDSTA